MKDEVENLHKAIVAKIGEYDKNLLDVGTEIKAMEKVFQKVMLNAGPSLLEPVVSLEVTVPEEFMGDVMSDLTSRRGRIQGIEAEGAFQVIKASIPESELFQYSNTLKSLTQARGSFSQTYEGYKPVPREIQESIMAKVETEDE